MAEIKEKVSPEERLAKIKGSQYELSNIKENR